MHGCTDARMHECTDARMHKRTVCIVALLHLCIAAFLIAGCTRAHAKTAPDAPPLDMPVPPPRDVEPKVAEVPAPAPLAEEPEPARRAPARPRPAPPRSEPAPAEPPKPVEEPARPPTTLQTTPAGAEGEVERTIRTVLTRATADLNRIDYRALNADARTQYDTAKRFVSQAQDALRGKNLVFARNLADKAAALAAQLAGR